MATTNFYLKTADQKGLSLVFLVYSDKGKKFKISTGIKVKKGNWKNGKLAKGKASEVNETNSLLQRFKEEMNEILREGIFNKSKYSIDLVQKKFRMKIGGVSSRNEFHKIYEEFMEDSKATKTHGTILSYNATFTRLKDYEVYTREALSFEKINQSFYERFIKYLIEKHDLLNNSVGRHIKVLKVFLNYCKQMQ